MLFSPIMTMFCGIENAETGKTKSFTVRGISANRQSGTILIVVDERRGWIEYNLTLANIVKKYSRD